MPAGDGEEANAGGGGGGGAAGVDGGGGGVLTIAVGKESSSSSPALFVTFTRTRSRNPRSAEVTVYVAALASLMSPQSSGLSALQRRHLYSIFVTGSPAASNVAESVSPTKAPP